MVVQLNVANVAVASRLADPITTAAPLSSSGSRSFNDALRTAQVETAPPTGPAPPPAKSATPPAKSTPANAPPAAKKPGDSAEQAATADAPDSAAAPADAAPVVKSVSDSANADATSTPQDDGDQPSAEVKDEAATDEESAATVSDAVAHAAAAIAAAAETTVALPAVAEVAATQPETVAVAPAVDAKVKTARPATGKEKPAPAGARAPRAQTEKTATVEKPTVEATSDAQAAKDVVDIAAASGEAAEAPVVTEAPAEGTVVAPEAKKAALKSELTEAATTAKPAAETPQSPGAASQQAVALEATQGPAAETELKTETEPAAKRDVADVRTSEKTSAPLGATLATDASRPASATSAEAADATAAAIDSTTLDAAVETASLDGSSPRGNDTSAPNSQIAPAVAAPAAEAPRSVAHQVRHADVTQQVQNLNESERLRLIQRVSKALQSAGDAGGVLRLRLTPPELGAVRMEIKVRDGVMQAHLTAETETARAVLLENVPALRDRLAEQSIRLERFEVDLSDAPAGGLTQQPGDQRQPYETHERGSSRGSAQRRGTTATAVAASAPNASRIFDDRGGLNVVI